MTDLTRKRCHLHPSREAVARCPQCGQFFCRECVTEHDGRILCTGCLAGLADTKRKNTGRMIGVFRLLQCAAGLFILWSLFYYTGQLLLNIPADFHEGAVWQRIW